MQADCVAHSAAPVGRPAGGLGASLEKLMTTTLDMKRILSPLFLAVAVLSLACSAFPALAQEKNNRNVDEVLAGQRLKQLSGLLQLADDQKEKAHAIILEEFKQARAVKESETLEIQEKFAKTDAIHAEAKVKLKALLNPEQLAKWDELEKKSAAKKKK
jgi:hypothetical protein